MIIGNSSTGAIAIAFYTGDVQEIACSDGYEITSKPGTAEGDDNITAVCTLSGDFHNVPSCAGNLPLHFIYLNFNGCVVLG